eukprot:gnl/TRDRNA2_/TRDRNA2_153118_c0_seq1.p1 gnl/TRDRNA2_/TRDRNA2_153118_c0~~gnl/TRDRNA2_/TRDRNA2_153118_c0_seq1.p1  ORF type:complete len:290 (+),score=61.93 gnl/TRDRNA2_/TRDRNA2_153118_c0_seq1:113-982(+)
MPHAPATTALSGVKRPASESPGPGKRARRAPPPPAVWRADWPVIQELRAVRDAPVDYIGCNRLADTRTTTRNYEWQCLVAAMLSSQTKDQKNAEAMANLRTHGNTIASIAATREQKLDQMIAMVGFHTTKAKNIKAAAKICLQEHGGRVPKTLEALMALPGVGPKMAHLTLLAAFGVQAGLCVDTHVHRIANALGWVKTGSAEETRKALEVWLPKEHWPDLNILLVGLGQQQQQEIQKLVDKCITSSSPQKALRLIARIGVELRAEKFPKIVEIAKTNAALRRLLVIQK